MINLKRPDGVAPEDLHLSRRGAIAGALFAGYAVAARSADAEPIHTDQAGLATGLVTLSSGIHAYVARPAAPGRHPAVLVIHEAFGLHEYIRDVCRRFAKLGYVAIAPAFFQRLGDPAGLADLSGVMKIVNATPDAQVSADIDAAVAYLKAQTFVDANRMAVTGFCWGGRWAWLACERVPAMKAGAAWYGQMVPTPVGELIPKAGLPPAPDRVWPIEQVQALHASVLGLYGGKDQLTTTVTAMRQALETAHIAGTEFVIYPNAAHGFHADYRASYDEADAKDGWARLLAHFKRNGVGPGAAQASS